LAARSLCRGRWRAGGLPAGRDWPRWLQSKWLSVVLLVLFLWAYEVFSFVGQPLVDRMARTRLFCYGLRHRWFSSAAPRFANTSVPSASSTSCNRLVSPLEVKVVNESICSTCRTKDCIRGSDGIPGCELHLFQPRKSGNMDCTFCLDCIHACPHANVAFSRGRRAATYCTTHIAPASVASASVPTWPALVSVLVFGAFANAAGMVCPVQAGGID